jgi:hypothetical protein
MKRIIFIAVVLLFASSGYAQKDSSFYKHEVKMSVGDAFIAMVFWTYEPWQRDRRNNAELYANVSFSYFYRPVKWFWVGGNFINYIGNRIHYDWREYYPNGKYRDFSVSKIKYCCVAAPEIRFSYLNHKSAILYSALSGGIGWENGFDRRHYKYPEINYYFHITLFGFSCNFGKNKNIFLGGELGLGFKGFGNIHGGYRF